MPQVTLYGAAHEVTGSCYLVETDSCRFLVDCGLFQGPRRLERLNSIPSSLQCKRLDAVFLTHGHLDHCGRLPMLYRSGFRGPIYATDGTIDISKLILRDAAKIQSDDARRETAKRIRMGEPPVEPLFTLSDVERVCTLFQPIEYDQSRELLPGVLTKFVEAGHLLGSASIILEFTEADRQTVVFSGDLGQWDVPILRDPAVIESADVIFMESTYGDRDHRSLPDTINEFEQLIETTIANRGKILIPTFAVGRAQQVLYHLSQMFRQRKLPHFPIYLDSPMAIAATELYLKHVALMDEEASRLSRSGELKRSLHGLIACATAEESMALNAVEGPCLIMAGAGMCNAGRILHHLRHNLSDPGTVVLIVGFQPSGSLGRMLLEGASEVKIHGKLITVNATIKGLGGFSAHAGQAELIRWIRPMTASRPRVYLCHGENHPIACLTKEIASNFGIEANAPRLGEPVQL